MPNFHDISTDVKTISTDNRWKTFFLVGFGKPSANNIAQCPKTWEALQKIPGLKTAMFSIFDPGKHLPAHRGPYNGVLRLHLGLIVPEPRDKIAIRVDKQICHWSEGKVLIFDDAYEHEAWNHSDKLARRAVRRFREADALSGQLRQLAAVQPRHLHAVHPGRHGEPQGLGEEVLRRSREAQEREQ